MKGIFKTILTVSFSYLGYFVGGFDTLMITLLIFMLCDYITGIMCAIKKKKLSSKVGFTGIAKKIFIILLVGLVNLLGIAINIEGLRYLAISFYIGNEFISIIENASIFGIRVPEKIKGILGQLKDNKEG